MLRGSEGIGRGDFQDEQWSMLALAEMSIPNRWKGSTASDAGMICNGTFGLSTGLVASVLSDAVREF